MEQSLDSNGQEAFPTVFYCVKCDKILGDSLSWINQDTDRPVVSLSGNNLYYRSTFLFHWEIDFFLLYVYLIPLIIYTIQKA